MSRVFLLLIALSVGGVFGCTAARAPDPKYKGLPTRTITGRVEDLDTNAALPGARVILFGPGGRVWSLAKTKWDGSFSLVVPDVEGHNFRVEVRANDYWVGKARIPAETPPLFVLRLVAGKRPFRKENAVTWSEARSPSFRVVTNAELADAREVVAELERFREVLRASAGQDVEVAEPALPMTVYALRSEADLRELVPDAFDERTAGLGGLFRRTRYATDIFLVLGDRDSAGALNDPGSTIRHEYQHAYFDRAHPFAPAWLREGMADVWSSARVRNGQVSVGQVNPDDVLYLQKQTLLPLTALMKVGPGSPEYRERDRAGVFYVQSMLLTHYLLYKIVDGRAKLDQFCELVDSGVEQQKAVEQVWGDLVLLQARFSAYVEAGRFPYDLLPAPVSAPAEPLVFSDVSESRLLAIKGLTLARGEEPKRAAKPLALALEKDPGDALAQEGRLLLLDALSDRFDHHKEFEEASRNPDAGIAAHHLSILSAPRKRDRTPVDRKVFEQHVMRIRELAPRFSHGIALEAALRVDDDPTRARELALEAVKLAPEDGALFALRAARIFRSTGQREEAEQLARIAVTRALAASEAAIASNVCQLGARAGWAAIVAPVCDRAVALAPDSWRAHDARAFQRALTGDRAGAIADLRFVIAVDDPLSETHRKSRAPLIELLEKTKGPLTPAKIGVADDPFL